MTNKPNDYKAFVNGEEFQRYLKTDSYKKFDKSSPDIDLKIVAGGAEPKKVSNIKSSGLFNFKEYDDGSVESITKAKTLKYYEWLKVYGKTHKKDGSLKNEGIFQEE